MDKETRNAIERATQRSRRLLEEDVASQLSGTFDVMRDGAVAPHAGRHLSARQAYQREKIVAAIEHKRAGDMSASEAVLDYLRDAAFTTLNRFVALKMLEARGVVLECISKGEQSSGYREYAGMSPAVALLPDSAGYRLYIESLFDELSTEVKVLFDRRDPASVIWPRRATFERLLEVLNAPELATVWGEDETIGWVYQFFNSKEERAAMRDSKGGGSQAPRNSRELAVRNQFFTPRYVVEFLTDNTLGRIWCEMCGDATLLAQRCQYLIRRSSNAKPPRARKDPRDIRVLDPACGSGHFLLYSFDLLVEIYEEAYRFADGPPSQVSGRTLAEDFPTIEALRRAVPALILRHNLFGVDIDPRCAQIAQLALWMRAQRALLQHGISGAERPLIRRVNVVVAEPLVADVETLQEFLATLNEGEISRAFTSLIDNMSLAGGLGLLLQIEKLIGSKTARGQTNDLFLPSEVRMREAIDDFITASGMRVGTRRRLFADDAVQGVGLLEISELRFDSIVMNPPFGLMPRSSYDYLVQNYPSAYYDLAVSFMARGVQLLVPNGLCGAITTRAFMFVSDAKRFRTEVAIPSIEVLVDLGSGVMDGAAVDASAQVLTQVAQGPFLVFDLRNEIDKASALARAINVGENSLELQRIAFDVFPGHQIAYDAVASLSHVFSNDGYGVEPRVAIARIGASTFDDERFLRARWEVEPVGIGSMWLASSRTAEEFSLYYYPPQVLVNWARDGQEVCARNEQVNGQSAQARQGSTHYGRSGVVFARRSSPSIAFRAHPAGCAFASNTGVVLPHDGIAPVLLLAVLNSSAIRAAVVSLSNRDSYTVGHVKRIRWPEIGPSDLEELSEKALRILAHKHWLFRTNETDPWFESREIFSSEHQCSAAYERWLDEAETVRHRLIGDYQRIDERVAQLLGVESNEDLRRQFGLDVSDILQPARLFTMPWDEWISRCVSIAVGVAFGRWRLSNQAPPFPRSCPDVFFDIPSVQPGENDVAQHAPALLVDDVGHQLDLVVQIEEAWSRIWPLDVVQDFERTIKPFGKGVREWLAQDFFAFHLDQYTTGKRVAPVYWQLSVGSASFSVWLYLHAVNKDTLYQLQSEYLAPRLAHEERKAASLLREIGEGGGASERRALTAQESLVNELRAFIENVKFVAPLWLLNLDDGVVINFSILWRLVAHNKPWQKELRSVWDALCIGDYDWAHLAMHLWPERVVPKCATDRSVAIAHGLESVFWIENAAGKWRQRTTPERSIEALVDERMSLAVKAALNDFLLAQATPFLTGTARRKGPR